MSGIDIPVIGWILMGAGALGLVVTLLIWALDVAAPAKRWWSAGSIATAHRLPEQSVVSGEDGTLARPLYAR